MTEVEKKKYEMKRFKKRCIKGFEIELKIVIKR